MKHLSIKKIFKSMAISLVIVGGVFSANYALAGWNDASSGECQTFSLGNVTTNEGIANPCWTRTSLSPKEGDVINVKIYFHNNTGSTVNDVRVRVTDSRNATGSFTLGGAVLVGSNPVASGNGSINLPSGTKLEYVRSVVQFQKTNYAIEDKGATTQVFFPNAGLSVGSIASTWGDQGVVKVVYKVVGNDNGPVDNDNISASTDDVDILDEDSGNVRFSGSYVSSKSPVNTYFEYRGPEDGSTSRVSKTGTSGNFNASVNGLESGDYEYRACATSSAGQDCGDWENFSLNGDSNSNDSLDVTTKSPDIIDEQDGDVIFNGSYEGNDDGNADAYFEYRREGGSIKTTNSSSYSSRSRSFDRLITGLSEGDYEYRACVKNDSDEDCGSWRSFSIDRSDVDDNDDDERAPSVQTIKPFQVLADFATLDGSYDMNGCSGSTWFEYGTTQSMTSRSNKVSRSSNASGYMTQSITSLSPNTVYYYRAVAENCQGTTRGSTYSFTTTRNSVIVNPVNPVRPVTPVVNVGGGARYVRLTIDNGRDSVMKGDELVYDVTWENITKLDLKDLVLEVAFPEGLQLVSTDRGQMDRAANTVYVNINELEAFEKDDMTIRARVIGASTIRDNDSITARAIIAFENPENNKAQENAIAYDSDSYYINQNNVLGASIFGLGFLPGTLAGWLFLILLLILVILIIRYAIRREEHHHHYHGASSPEGTSVTTTKVVTEEEYTPYRPTPKE